MVYKTQPAAHMSTLSSYEELVKVSGGLKAIVPVYVFIS